jgi:hypothetical protein
MNTSITSRYCRVDEQTCSLIVSKTKDQSSPTRIDLKVVVDIKPYEKVTHTQKHTHTYICIYMYAYTYTYTYTHIHTHNLLSYHIHVHVHALNLRKLWRW